MSENKTPKAPLGAVRHRWIRLAALALALVTFGPLGTVAGSAPDADAVATRKVAYPELPQKSTGLDLAITAQGYLSGAVANRLLELQPALSRNPYSLLIEFDPKADEAEIEQLLIRSKVRLVSRFSDTNLYQLETTRDLSLVKAELEQSDQVLLVDFDATVRESSETPSKPVAEGSAQATNDPFGNSHYMWGLFGTHGINAEDAWSATPSLNEIVVAVVDSGVDVTHGDLVNRLWVNPGEIAGNGIDDDNNGFIDDIHGWDFVDKDADPSDPRGHGTHVAGTIAAERGNNRGVAGVADNARIMALRFLNADGNGYASDALNALDYALDQGAQISNHSWGGSPRLASFSAALDRANSLNHLFVAAAGNETNNNDVKPTYPASYSQSNVLSVAATESSSGGLDWFSNYGVVSVDVAAPGQAILSTYPRSFANATTVATDSHGDPYALVSGTSMAAPHVAGIASLLLGVDPTLTPQETIGLIIDGGRLRSNLNTIRTSRTVDAAASLALLDLSPPTIVISGATEGDELFQGEIVNLTATATSSYGADLSDSVEWRVDSQAVPSIGAAFTFSPSTRGALSVTATVSDANGRTASSSITFTVTEQLFRFTKPDQSLTLAPGGSSTTTWLWPGSSSATADLSMVPIYRYPVAPSAADGAVIDNATTSILVPVKESFNAETLSVGLRLRHTYVGDLTIRLTNPSGATVTLFAEHGGSANDFGQGSTNCAGELTYFNATAPYSVEDATPPYVGPVRPLESLSTLLNSSPSGTWRLDVTDSEADDLGTIDCVELEFTNGTASSLIASGVRLADESLTISHDSLLPFTLTPESRLVFSGSGVATIAAWGTLADSSRFPPSEPRSVNATPNGTTHGLRVEWSTPLSRGGGPITGYVVREGSTKVCETNSAMLHCDIGSLTAGAPYEFTVTAENQFGESRLSAASSVVDVPTLKTSAQVGVDCYSTQIHGFVDVRESFRVTNDVGCIAQLGVTTGCNPSQGLYCPDAPVLREQIAAFLTRMNTTLISGGCSTDHPFTDVSPSSYASDAIGCLVQLGVTTGKTPTTFGPRDPMTRAQMAAFLARYLVAVTGEPCTGTHPFTDVSQSSYAYGPVGCIYQIGITTGTSRTTYSPNEFVTREQMASFLARLYRALTA